MSPARRVGDPGDLEPLFYPRGIVVTGVSSHPGKFGTAAFHNLRRFGFEGELFPIHRDGAEILGTPTLRSIEEVPAGAADLVFVCTPPGANLELLRACAERGIRAAFFAAAGYGEAGEQGRQAEQELVELANELGMVLAGPNGQGLISTRVSMCAQIVAPYPPPGPISMVSQSGNIGSSFMNYGVLTGVGFSKGISCGNSAQLELADFLEYYASDRETACTLAYLEGIEDGRRFLEAARNHGRRKPLVVLRGGITDRGRAAASSHPRRVMSQGARPARRRTIRRWPPDRAVRRACPCVRAKQGRRRSARACRTGRAAPESTRRDIRPSNG